MSAGALDRADRQLDALVEVAGLRIAVDGGRREVVHGVDVAIPRGGTVGFVGESGSGKTLICRALLGLLPPGVAISGGAIRYGGRDVTRLTDRQWRGLRGADLAAVFQDPASYLNPSIRVGHQLAEVLRVRMDLRRRDARRRALELLEQLGLHRPELVYGQYTNELSGGMLQRVLLAIALAAEPELLIADEAMTALDVTIQAEVLDVLTELQRTTGLTLLVVSHDLAVVAQLCDHVYVLQHGNVVEHGPTRAVLDEQREPYTRRLVASHLAFGVEHVRDEAVA
jgi:ABC-type glutathione transport system ATPase component